MGREGISRRSTLTALAAGMTGLASCESLQTDGQQGQTEMETTTITRHGVEGVQMQAAWDGRVVPVAPGLGPSDAIDPSETDTPLSDAVSIIDEVGEKPGKGAVLLPPQQITQDEPVRPSQFIQFLGWGPQTSNVTFTNLSEDGFRVTALKEGKFVYLDGFTISGADKQQRQDGSAIHFANDEASPKQFNIGYIAFREWIDPVLDFENGSLYGSTWRHLDFGWDGNRGREILLRKNQSLMGTQIDYISAGNATGDAVLSTNFAAARIKIGFINIGGSAGQAANITSARNGRIYIDGINFESGVSTDKPIVELQGQAPVRLGHVRNTDATVDSIVRLTANNANKIIEHVRNLNGFGATVRTGKIDLASEPAGPSYYFGTTEDITNTAGATTNRFWALGDMQAADSSGRPAQNIPSYSGANADDLSTGEIGVDTDPDGNAGPCLVFKGHDGELHRWDSEPVR